MDWALSKLIPLVLEQSGLHEDAAAVRAATALPSCPDQLGAALLHAMDKIVESAEGLLDAAVAVCG